MSPALKSLVNTVSKFISLLFIDVERRDTSPILFSLIFVFLTLSFTSIFSLIILLDASVFELPTPDKIKDIIIVHIHNFEK